MKLFLLISLALISFKSFAQNPPVCKDLKEGIFYEYEKNSTKRYVIYRSGNEQIEVNPDNGDTAVWRIDWKDDCICTLKLMSTNINWPPEQAKFVRQHKFIFSILNLTNDYYTFKGTVDKLSNQIIIEDTIWMTEKLQPSNGELFKLVQDAADVKKMKDSSSYAILNIYRPGKLTNSLGNYMIYFDNIPMCLGINNSGYTFKILKEGKFQVASRILKDDSSVDLDIKFGQVYYVKSMVHWGMYKHLYNFKLEMLTVPKRQGEAEFSVIKNK